MKVSCLTNLDLMTGEPGSYKPQMRWLTSFFLTFEHNFRLFKKKVDYLEFPKRPIFDLKKRAFFKRNELRGSMHLE